MKLIFNLCMAAFILGPVSDLKAREIILIENQSTKNQGLLLKKILRQKFHLPERLITLRNSQSPCEISSDAVVHLCLLTDGELKVVKMNDYVVKNSLGIFLNQETEEMKND